MENKLIETVKKSKEASYKLASINEETKNKALLTIADKLKENEKIIFEANKKDLENASKLLSENKISKSIFDRLKLDENKMRDMILGIIDVTKLEDPVGKTLQITEMDKDLILRKVTCPIGLIAVIFEARPDVISQISSLCIKSSNAVILKGGSEGEKTNRAVFDIINESLSSIKDFPENSINIIHSRDEVNELLKMDSYINLIIPRGGNDLVKYIKDNTNIPVLGHADGICHIYVDKNADINNALNICLDSKIQYPSACNAVETILVNKNIANDFLPRLYEIFEKNEVSMNSDKEIKKIIPNVGNVDSWTKEYGDKKVSIKIVENVKDAINHINEYGSHHTDSIISEDENTIKEFMDFVDSANVFANASTRFSDGFRYGFGAEVGISTNKTHARGPVGLEGLVIYKYKLYGKGQLVDDYVKHKRKFNHKKL